MKKLHFVMALCVLGTFIFTVVCKCTAKQKRECLKACTKRGILKDKVYYALCREGGMKK